MTVAASPQPPAERPGRAASVSAVLLLESAVASVVGAFLATGSIPATVIAAVVAIISVALVLWFLTQR
ncbi:hypothetical protein ACQP2Y_46805 (plasmid) [Actinoplanes sp. CA-051413]|uniref:hypothetical protein n=1 Tax=Actinoplanes sp. CA-051413 TaxID=3239899 RepID=UPI003D992730